LAAGKNRSQRHPALRLSPKNHFATQEAARRESHESSQARLARIPGAFAGETLWAGRLHAMVGRPDSAVVYVQPFVTTFKRYFPFELS